MFKRVFKYREGTENDAMPDIKLIGFVDPASGRTRWAGTRGVHCGEVPTTGTYVEIECDDGVTRREFEPYQRGR